MKKRASLILLILICMTLSVSAHPGSLDENGGHWNRKTGEYHYHDGTNTGSGGSGLSSSNMEYDNVVFKDEVGGIKFLIPENWTQETLVNSSNQLQVAFDCNNPPTTLFYHRDAVNYSGPINEEIIAEGFEVEQTTVKKHTYNSNIFYCFSYDDGEMSFYYAVTFTDGYMHMFLQYPDNNKISDELDTLLASFVVPHSSDVYFADEEVPVVSEENNHIENVPNDTASTESNSQYFEEPLNIANILKYIFIGLFLLICVLYYGAPLFSRISDFIYEKVFEKHLPKYNLWMYEQTMDSIKHYEHELNCSKRIIDDFHEIGIPDLYEIGSDDLPKEKGSSDWGKKFTVYRSKHSKKLHVQYNCCNATEKCHIYQTFILSFDPYDSLCKKGSQYYKIPDLKWYQTYKDFPKAEKNYVVSQKALNDLYQKLYAYNKKCNSTYMKFLLSFNKNNLNKLQTLNCSMQQLLN